MFSRIIVATDLSPASFAVVNCLGGLRAFGAKQCLLLQCLNFQQASSIALSYTTAPLEDFLGQQKEILEKQGFEVEAKIVPGFAKREINRVAAEEDYSLVVVGSQGHSMVGEAIVMCFRRANWRTSPWRCGKWRLLVLKCRMSSPCVATMPRPASTGPTVWQPIANLRWPLPESEVSVSGKSIWRAVHLVFSRVG